MKPSSVLVALSIALAGCTQQTDSASDESAAANSGAMSEDGEAEMASDGHPNDELHNPANYADEGRLVDHLPFTQAAFEAAQAEGRPILVDVYAPWCPVCARQQTAIAAAQAMPANSDLVVFRLDFDDQKDELRQFRVTSQATLITFDGDSETGRLLGETDPDMIAELIGTAS